jgi:hypothetical protein
LRIDLRAPIGRLWWAGLLSLGSALPLVAQDPRLAARLPSGTAIEVQRLIDLAERDNLPTDPLVQKALEGESKGADSARIIHAIEGLLGRLRAARSELGPEATEAELVAAAAALRAGALPTALDTLRSLRRDKPLVVPLSVLADLLTVGVPAEEAWRSVREMASTGATDAQFLALRDRLASAPPKAGASNLRPPAPERPPAGSPPGPAERP